MESVTDIGQLARVSVRVRLPVPTATPLNNHLPHLLPLSVNTKHYYTTISHHPLSKMEPQIIFYNIVYEIHYTMTILKQ